MKKALSFFLILFFSFSALSPRIAKAVGPRAVIGNVSTFICNSTLANPTSWSITGSFSNLMTGDRPSLDLYLGSTFYRYIFNGNTPIATDGTSLNFIVRESSTARLNGTSTLVVTPLMPANQNVPMVFNYDLNGGQIATYQAVFKCITTTTIATIVPTGTPIPTATLKPKPTSTKVPPTPVATSIITNTILPSPSPTPTIESSPTETPTTFSPTNTVTNNSVASENRELNSNSSVKGIRKVIVLIGVIIFILIIGVVVGLILFSRHKKKMKKLTGVKS